MFSMSRSAKISTVENFRQLCEELFLLKCICFCWLSLGNNSISKCEVAKAKFCESLKHLFFFLTAMLIIYIKGGTSAQIFLERGSAMTRATFVIFWPKLSSFIDWCCYYTQVSYACSWEPLVYTNPGSRQQSKGGKTHKITSPMSSTECEWSNFCLKLLQCTRSIGRG